MSSTPAYIQALRAAAAEIIERGGDRLVADLRAALAQPDRDTATSVLRRWAAVSTGAAAPAQGGCRDDARARRYQAAAAWIRTHGSEPLRGALAAHEATVETRRPKMAGGDGSLTICTVARRRTVLVRRAEAEGFGMVGTEGAVDVVYTLHAAGGKYKTDWELRHSIRSWFAHFAALGRIWIVGARPAWLRTSDRIRFIEMGDPTQGCKDANLIRKILRVCEEPELTDEFLFCSDDQILLRDMTAAAFRPFYRFDLAESEKCLAGGGKWRRRLARTAAWLMDRGLPALHYDAHVPMPFSKTDYPQIMSCVPDWELPPGYTINTIYHNQRQGIEPAKRGRMLKVTLETRKSDDEVEALLARPYQILGFNNSGLTDRVRAWVEAHLPEASQAEGDRARPEPAQVNAVPEPEPPAPWPGDVEPADRAAALGQIRRLTTPLVVSASDDDWGTERVIEPCQQAEHRCRTRLLRQTHDALVIDAPGCEWAADLAEAHGLALYDLCGRFVTDDPAPPEPLVGEILPGSGKGGPVPGLSVVIPICGMGDCAHRLAAFRHVLDSVRDALAPGEIVVCEQVEPGTREFRRYWRKGVRHVRLERAGKPNRGATRNAGAAAATGGKLLILDADVLLDWPKVAEAALALRHGTVVKPFDCVYRLSEEDTARVLSGEPVSTDERRRSVSVLGGGALLITAGDFSAVRGYGERDGWGYEDEELGARLRQYDVEEIAASGWHCCHPLADRAESKGNRLWCERLQEMTPLEAVAQVESSVRQGEVGARHLRDVALLMVAYGDCPQRVEATRRALEIIRWLDPMPEVFFLEILDEGQTRPRYIPDWMQAAEWCHCETLTMHPENVGAWQKEAGLNRLGARAMSAGCTKVVTLDPDSRPDRVGWIQSISDHLDERPHCALQPWRSVCDTEDETRANTPSYAYAKACGQERIARGPGLSWAMTVETWRALGGLNPFFCPGGGDTGFVLRIDPDGPISRVPRKWAWWDEVLALQPAHPLEIDFLNVDKRHENHGKFADRAYTGRNVSVERLGVSVLRNMWLDDRGLVAISRTPEGEAIRHVLLHKARLHDELDDVVTEALEILKGVRKSAQL